MAAIIPVAFSVAKSLWDEAQAESKDAATRAAGRAKLEAMRQGAGQMESYRQSLRPQMLQAMQNRMQAYTPSQSVLSQMYGGHPPPQMGQLMPHGTTPRPVAGGPTLLGQMATPGPAINPGTPGGARAGANPYFGQQFAPNVGFGGEMPMPADLLRRRV
jgi:hypothetical protein